VSRVVDTVVGDAVLGDVVGADLLRPLAAADLGAPGGVHFFALLALLDVKDASAEDSHRLGTVLELGAFVLADGDNAGGEVGEAHGGGVLLYALAAVAAGVEDVNAELLFC